MERSGASSPTVLVGRVVRPIGLRGEVVVRPTGGDAARFAQGTRFQTRTEPPRELQVRGSRPYRDRFAVRFAGIDTIEAAEGLRDVWLCIPEEALPALPAGVYYHYQVIGLTVVDAEGVVLGRLESILEAGSNDVYCVGEGDEEILIPAVRDYVERVDLKSGRLFLRVPKGALGMDDEPV